MMSYWNIESGGRNRKYLDKSLLRPGKGGVLMRRLWHVLEVVAIYALKRLIDWFFTTKN